MKINSLTAYQPQITANNKNLKSEHQNYAKNQLMSNTNFANYNSQHVIANFGGKYPVMDYMMEKGFTKFEAQDIMQALRDAKIKEPIKLVSKFISIGRSEADKTAGIRQLNADEITQAVELSVGQDDDKYAMNGFVHLIQAFLMDDQTGLDGDMPHDIDLMFVLMDESFEEIYYPKKQTIYGREKIFNETGEYPKQDTVSDLGIWEKELQKLNVSDRRTALCNKFSEKYSFKV